MEFKLQNYNQLLSNKHYIDRLITIVENDDVEFLLPKPSNEISTNFDSTLSNVINQLNNHPILNYSSIQKISIVFENFSLYNKLKDKLFNEKNREDAFYNYPSQKVFIRENLLNRNSREDSFSASLFRKVNIQDYLNFIVLHELGHAVHHQYFLDNKNHLPSNDNLSNFINKTINLTGFININVPYQIQQIDELAETRNLHRATFNALKENFSDSFACLAITQIYPKEKALNIIQSVHEARVFAKKYRIEDYHTDESIALIMDDFKNNKLNFNNFSDLYNYQSNLVKSTIANLLDKQFANTNPFDLDINNYYLGFVNQKLNLNKKSATEVLQELKSQNITKVSNIKNLELSFEQGIQAAPEHTMENGQLESLSLKSKIHQLRETTSSSQLSIKDKINLRRIQTPQNTNTSNLKFLK